MPVREGPPQPAPSKDPADNMRGGGIVLRPRLQRAIFIAGLIAAILLGLLLQIAR